MITEFNGFTEGVIGKKLPVDTTLNNMKKSELIELLHTAQHNYDTLMQFYTNAINVNMDKWKEHDKEIRNNAIEEFSEKLCENRVSNDPVVIVIKSLLEQMKEVGE